MEIPIYDNVGSRAGLRSLESINRLLAVNLVTVVRKRNGTIVRAIMRQPDGSPGVRPTAHMGQSYVHRELLPTGHHAYKHKPLPRGQADIFVRSIFRRVALDCMA